MTCVTRPRVFGTTVSLIEGQRARLGLSDTELSGAEGGSEFQPVGIHSRAGVGIVVDHHKVGQAISCFRREVADPLGLGGGAPFVMQMASAMPASSVSAQ